MKILVTGAAGFIGSHLTNFLVDKGHHVRGADIRPSTESYLPSKANEFVQCDLRKLQNAVDASKDMDWVITLAADMGGMGYLHEFHAKIMRNNALININMADAAKLVGVKRILFSSSACVYPEFRQMKSNSPSLKESDALPAWPDLPYGWEKLFSEFLYASYAKDYGLPVRIARFHNVYGSHSTYAGGREKAPAALCRKVAEAKNGGKLIVWGDGKARRSFLYIDDCLELVWRLMNSNYAKPLNIGTDKSISVDELAILITKISGKHLMIKHDLSKPQGVRGRNANLTLMKHTLHYTPKVNYPEGMAKLYRWVEKQIGDKQSTPTTV
jgi:nucleoside-diphosphate-sugar epimerase